jgi:hypothetical protein
MARRLKFGLGRNGLRPYNHGSAARGHMDWSAVRSGLTIAGISAVAALLSSIVALYTQLSGAVGEIALANGRSLQ